MTESDLTDSMSEKCGACVSDKLKERKPLSCRPKLYMSRKHAIIKNSMDRLDRKTKHGACKSGPQLETTAGVRLVTGDVSH